MACGGPVRKPSPTENAKGDHLQHQLVGLELELTATAELEQIEGVSCHLVDLALVSMRESNQNLLDDRKL